MWNTLLKRSFNGWSNSYDDDISRSFSRRNTSYERIAEKIREHLPVTVSGHILELGVGSGKLGLQFKDLNPIGLDISEHMLLIAETTRSYSLLLKSPADKTPFMDGYFDSVYSTFMFHSIRNQNAALREYQRILRPGGILLIVDLFTTIPRRDLTQFLWSNVHSFKYEKMAPSNYKSTTGLAALFSKYFVNVGVEILDSNETVPGNSPGRMSHGIVYGERQ